jgi:hypothetical protein
LTYLFIAWLVGWFSIHVGLQGDAIVLGSANVLDYPLPWVSGGMPTVIYGQNLQNTGIIGGGVIDGQAVPMFVAVRIRFTIYIQTKNFAENIWRENAITHLNGFFSYN